MSVTLGKRDQNNKDNILTALNFYDIALTNCTHQIITQSFDYFQSLVDSLLQTQLVYHNPAYITQENLHIRGANNLYKELSILTESSDIQEYVMHKFFSDILFIEKTATLESQPWYKKTIAAIQNQTRHKAIPIIIATL